MTSRASKPPAVTRRTILKCSLLGGAALGAPEWAAFAVSAGPPIVETASGKVRGSLHDGVSVFKGIPYGAPVDGPHRFTAPRKAVPWTGVRDAVRYGPIAMQTLSTPASDPDMRSLQQGNTADAGHERSENCLVLNVWTPSTSDARKRPVMIWCHGGGFENGMGDSDWSDGTNLARLQDVVVVSFNHRLNAFGFLYLGENVSEQYADSGNLGMLDIVAMLRWVRENIAAFGGDPGSVTVFGCSGGASKVSALMAMPSAKGLFHKAIAESGSLCRVLSREDATRTTHDVLAELDLKSVDVDRLQKIPALKLLEAMARAAAARERNGPLLAQRQIFEPVVDGRTLARHPFDPDAPLVSVDVPMIVGTTKDEESSMGASRPYLFTLDMAGLRTQVKKLGIPDESIEPLIKAYGASRPGGSPSDIFFAMARDRYERNSSILQAERKSALGGAPAYMYLYAWEIPGSKYKAIHCVQKPFAFANADRAPGYLGGVPDSRYYDLAHNTSAAWAAFARTGNPSHPGLPEWKPYTAKDRATMVFNYKSELVNDPLREDRIAMQPFGPGPQG